jgi:hypothetical protein
VYPSTHKNSNLLASVTDVGGTYALMYLNPHCIQDPISIFNPTTVFEHNTLKFKFSLMGNIGDRYSLLYNVDISGELYHALAPKQDEFYKPPSYSRGYWDQLTKVYTEDIAIILESRLANSTHKRLPVYARIE